MDLILDLLSRKEWHLLEVGGARGLEEVGAEVMLSLFPLVLREWKEGGLGHGFPQLQFSWPLATEPGGLCPAFLK